MFLHPTAVILLIADSPECQKRKNPKIKKKTHFRSNGEVEATWTEISHFLSNIMYVYTMHNP